MLVCISAYTILAKEEHVDFLTDHIKTVKSQQHIQYSEQATD